MPETVVVLSVWGSPVATAYLKTISAIPNLCIRPVFEKNEKIFADIQRIFKERFGAVAPGFAPPEASGAVLPPLMIEKLQSEETLKTIAALEPDWMVLAGSGIVKEPLLKIPRRGTLNCHPGILPRYRGCTCVEWALFEDEPVGATCHFVTPEIDAGDIVRKKTLPVFTGETYRDLRLRMFYFCAELMAESLHLLVNDPEQAQSGMERFDWEKSRYYKPIPAEQMEEVLLKIGQGSYRHLQSLP